MAYTTPVALYSATVDALAYTALTGVQSISVNRGRQRFQDPFPQSSCVIELIPATSYALPLAVGQFIEVRSSTGSTDDCYFVGRITDIERQYNIPYNSTTGAAPGDRIIITSTGGTGALASNNLNAYTWTTSGYDSITNLCTSLLIYPSIPTSTISISAQTFTGGALDGINGILRTMQYIIDDFDTRRGTISGSSSALICIPFGYASNLALTVFTDQSSGGRKFVNVQYLSSVQNSFTQVLVEAAGLANQVASSGVAPYNTLVYDSYSSTTAEALNLATYILAVNSQTTAVPYSITTNTNVDSTAKDLARIANNTDGAIGIIGQPCQVVFRGTTVTASVQGIQTNFYSDYAQVKLYLSPSLGTPFTLDSTAFGVLDTNRLGYP